MYLLHVRPFTNILPFFPQNFASTNCVSRRRCSTDSTPTCTPLYLRIVAALMKRIAARCTPNRRVVERAMRDAHLLDIPYKCSSRSDYSFRLMRQPAFPPILSLFFSFLQRRPPRQFCLVRRSADPQAG